METIITIVVIVFIVVYLVAQDSNKETKRERYGDAIGKIAHSTADTISGIAHDIAEPADKKKIRLAEEDLAKRNGMLYRFNDYGNKEYLKELFEVDESFKKSLDTLGLSEERWKKVGKHLFFVGVIRFFSRDHFDYSKKNEERTRYNILNKWGTEPLLKDNTQILREALSYFNIPEDEWIQYGDTVIDMHNINDNRDIEEFGIIVQIMPMKNNRHLL